jgi:hypothetical protein
MKCLGQLAKILEYGATPMSPVQPIAAHDLLQNGNCLGGSGC